MIRLYPTKRSKGRFDCWPFALCCMGVCGCSFGNHHPRNHCMTFQTVNGTAHDLVGQDKAHPIAMIRSVAMMLRLFFKTDGEAETIGLACTTCWDRILYD